MRLDFFRGLSLFFIFVDHIPENILSTFTFHAVSFCDAAEVFIFISGYTAALVYGQSLRRTGRLVAIAQIYRRVWQLYVAHIFLFMIFVAEVSYALIAAQNPMYAEELGVGDFLNTPHLAVIRALYLDFQPNFLDILPLYIVLLASFPIVLLGLEIHALLPLAVSGVLYVLTLHFGWALHTFPEQHVWYFNPLAWQFLFVIGATAGHARVLGAPPLVLPRFISVLSIVVAAAIAVICLSWTVHWMYDPFPPLFRKLWYLTLDKTDLAPVRLLSILGLAGAALYFVAPDARFLHSKAAWPVILCGQHSLYIFCLGILLSVLGHFILDEVNSGIAMQMAVNVAGMLTMIGIAAILQWFKTATRRAATSASTASSE